MTVWWTAPDPIYPDIPRVDPPEQDPAPPPHSRFWTRWTRPCPHSHHGPIRGDSKSQTSSDPGSVRAGPKSRPHSDPRSTGIAGTDVSPADAPVMISFAADRSLAVNTVFSCLQTQQLPRGGGGGWLLNSPTRPGNVGVTTNASLFPTHNCFASFAALDASCVAYFSGPTHRPLPLLAPMPLT